MTPEQEQKVFEHLLMQECRIKALERFINDFAVKALRDSPETATFLGRIEQYFQQNLEKARKHSPDDSRPDSSHN